ncbi:hypothetical protein, partial [Streptomyces sp. NPDC091416]|uniref:hypothetical protein n=1 Tax=Streptomyces sp. NPDC091416 TaxID=3366003 RepID=UPI00382313F5
SQPGSSAVLLSATQLGTFIRTRLGSKGRTPTLDRVLSAFHRRPAQIPRELLVGEPGQHCGEDLFLRSQQRDSVHQVQPCRTWDRPVEPHRSTTLRHSRRMRENRI